MRNLFLLISFFTVAPLVIIASIILLEFRSFTLKSNNNFLIISERLNNTQITYAALPSTQMQLDGSVNASDTRVERVKTFFRAYGSVLEQYSQDIVDAADKYNLDYSLLPGIALQESQGCKREIFNSHNCWGWGIYTHHTTIFESYPQAIDTISKLIAKNYVNKGADTLEEIQKSYNPTDTNNWTGNVSYFMSQVKTIL